MLPTHICKLCVFVISLSAVGNFNCTENIFKITEIPVTILSNNSHKRRIKLRYQKVNEVDPNSNQKNRICPFYLLLFSFLLFSHRHHPPLVIQFLSLLTKQRNAIQCDGDHLIWRTVCVWLQILSSSPLIYWCESCVRGDIGQQQIK